MELLLITLMIVYIVDISGAIEEMVEPMLARILKVKRVKLKKPWSCSRCLTFWVGMIYLLVTWTISIPYMAYVCLLSMLTPFFNNLLLMLYEKLNKLTDI